ncbi:aldehyde dehydrogenase (NAD+) [Geomicrobium halophilum]|uniref:3-sulfolactaldehyde dehydrogenase n=1 Tax=Geomicrobium halophilum TaxID=549000 RepID=A0A841PQC8_9BACL|nr:aldehyde dehydrogenase family protein [Geomicrobium halophilum]MBB6450949.1 aldehyde dehydrogenase (NAD+) [Geomicrobium halophilum]
MNVSTSKQYINGEWREGRSEKTLENYNPYTNDLITTIRSANETDLDEAYQAAEQAQREWVKLSPADLQQHLQNLLQVMKEEKETIVDWLKKEAGSSATKAEIEYGAALGITQEALSFPTRVSGTIFPSNIPNKENYVYRKAKGVIGVIGPWNFPFHLSMRSVAPAIASGNTVVIKPSSDTPVTSGMLLGWLFEKAGFPKGVVNVVVGRGSEIGDAFVTHPTVEAISFTGSTEVGRQIAVNAGQHLKDTALELGGNNAMLVLDDADVDAAVDAAIFGKFLHQGQICMALNRIIIDTSIHDEFLEKFTERTRSLPYGDPFDSQNVVGPLINQGEVERLQKEVNQAVEDGATLEVGGKHEGNVFEPTILSSVTSDMEIAKNELFGPVATILKAQGEQEAIDIANNTIYGLTGSVFTRDQFRGMNVARQVETGMIHVNDQPVNDEPHVAFGGEKHSGLGRFNGEWALDKFTTTQWVSVQSQNREYPF